MKKCRICEKKVILEEAITKKLRHKEDIYICKNCNTYFIYPHSIYAYDNYGGGNGLLDYYNSREDWIKNRMHKIFYKFKKYNKNGKSVLDIGSGMGFAGVVANEFNLKYTGIEPNKQLAQNAIENLNINCINDYFPLSGNIDKYDFIILDNVLEHIQDPKIFFNNIYERLNTDGILFIACPPIDWLRIFLSKSFLTEKITISRSFTVFDDLIQHINYFSHRSYVELISDKKDLKIISQFHHREWSLPIHKILNLTTGQYFIKKSII